MTTGKFSRRMRRPLRDFCLGLGLFIVVSASGMVNTGPSYSLFAESAHAGWLDIPADAVDAALDLEAVPGELERTVWRVAETGIMAVVLSGLLALNLWFARHLRRNAVAARRLEQRGALHSAPAAGARQDAAGRLYI